MEKTFIIIFIIILVSVAFSFSYWFLYKNKAQEEIIEIPSFNQEALIVQKVNFSGEIKKITKDTLILTTPEGNLEVLLNIETEIFNVDQVEEKDGVVRPMLKEINFDNIKIGEQVYISTEKGKEKTTATYIIVL